MKEDIHPTGVFNAFTLIDHLTAEMVWLFSFLFNSNIHFHELNGKHVVIITSSGVQYTAVAKHIGISKMDK